MSNWLSNSNPYQNVKKSYRLIVILIVIVNLYTIVYTMGLSGLP